MSNTTPKFPSVFKRPAGFTAAMEAGVVAKAAKSNITAEMVRAVIEGSDLIDEGTSPAEAWLATIPSIQPMHAWWALEKKETADRAMAELGEDAVEVSGPKSKAAERLRKRYVYCAMRNEVWDCEAKDWLSLQALDNLEAVNMPRNSEGRLINAWTILRTDPEAHRVHNERYMPGVDDRFPFADGVHWLNLWTAPSVKPRKGNAQPILDHFLYLCNGRQDHANHILDWFAYMYQNPGKKIRHALLIISPSHGVGKDTVGDQIARRLFGDTNVAVVQDEAVAEGRFDFMRHAQLVVVPEIMGGDRKDLANKLKPLITQPTVDINEKFIRRYTIQNMANFLFFSNHENAAYIEDEDRRYFVVICRQKPRTLEYFNALNDYIDSPAFSGFAHFLKTRDLSHFSPYAPAPWTEDKLTVQQATKGAVEAWLDDAYESGARPFTGHIINLRDALGVISDAPGAPKVTLPLLSAFLKRKGAKDLGPQRVVNGQPPVRVWAIRDAEAVEALPIEAKRRLYERPIFGPLVVGLEQPGIAAE